MSYPSRVELTGCAIQDAPVLYDPALWLDSNAVMERVLWETYLDANRELLGCVPERAMMSFEWRSWVAVPHQVLAAPRRMWWIGKWKKWQRRFGDPVVAFVEFVSDKLDLLEGPPVAAEYQFDLWKTRHAEEEQYVRELGKSIGLT